jgi:iron complex outermembrane receptor protein
MVMSCARARPGVTLLRAVLFSTTVLGAGTALAAEGDRPQVEEIVVTALKRETLLEQTPIAITAVPGTLLEDLGAFEFNDYFRRVPGLASVD